MVTESMTAGGGAPIRVGVVGANPMRGWGTAAHLPALRALDEYEITAVATTRPETARATAEAFGAPLAFDRAEDLVSHPDVDVVAIAVKVPDHDGLIRAALASRKHVFSEWPLGVDADQARRLAALADESGVVHVVGLQGYHAPGAVFVRELVDQGAIGKPLAVSIVTAGGPAGAQIPAANLYATDVAAGATVLSISTGHVLATLARAVGQLRSVSGVVALVNREARVKETGQTVAVSAPDQVVLAGRLDNDAALSIAVQGGAAPSGPGFEVRIVGTEATLTVRPASPGAIHITDWAVSIARADGSGEDLPVPDRLVSIPVSVPSGPPRNVAVLYRLLAHGITEGRPVTPDFAAAADHHQLLEAIRKASETGTVQAAGPTADQATVAAAGRLGVDQGLGPEPPALFGDSGQP
jgi:predicted dehydrogenase